MDPKLMEELISKITTSCDPRLDILRKFSENTLIEILTYCYNSTVMKVPEEIIIDNMLSEGARKEIHDICAPQRIEPSSTPKQVGHMLMELSMSYNAQFSILKKLSINTLTEIFTYFNNSFDMDVPIESIAENLRDFKFLSEETREEILRIGNISK